MSNGLYELEQDYTISGLHVLQMEGQGYGPDLVQDEEAESAKNAADNTLPAEQEGQLDRQAIAEMFKSVTSLRDDDLNRLLAEGSEPKLD